MEAITERILAEIDKLKQEQRRLASLTQYANIALGVQTYTVATLPVLTTLGGTQIAFASNGRNPAEGPGAGTGVLCWNRGDGLGWKRVADGTVVVA